MIKKTIKFILILIGLIIVVLIGLYFIPPSQEVIEYNYAEVEQNPFVNSKTGIYAADNGKNYQITWGSKQGLQLNHFDLERNNLKSLRLNHIEKNLFDTNGDLETVEVEFISQQNDSVLLLNVKTSKTEFTATKLENKFYHQEEIEYFNGDVKLAGLLMTPYQNSKSTAVVFIHGSGVSDRDNFWYMHQAHFLAQNGYTVLLPDKRGCGKSGGEWHTASFDDFSGDIVSALNYLSSNKQSELSKIGVIGISQGGWISHLVNQNTKLDFVIDVVGSSTTPTEQVKYEVMKEINSSGAPELLANPLSIVFAKRARGKRKIWWEKNGEFDPIPLMEKSKTRTLKIFANEDENVPVNRSLEEMDKLKNRVPDLPLEVKIFEGSGHALIDKETSWIRSDYLEYLKSWISKVEPNN